MHKYLYISNIKVPTYSLFVMFGIVVCCCAALIIAKKEQNDLRILLAIAFVGGLGGFVGAKLLPLIVNCVKEKSFISLLSGFKESNYSYFGGLYGFFTTVFIMILVKNEYYIDYARNYIFSIPLLHCFWKIGCYMGGCCFGIPYNGPGAIVFPSGVNSLSGVKVFPVQLLESIIAFIISLLLLFLKHKNRLCWPISTFLLLYGTSRFFIEYLRYHEYAQILYEGQVYSIICVVIGFCLLLVRRNKVGLIK